MTRILPGARPAATREQVLAALAHAGHDVTKLTPVFLVGWRGYYEDTMGRKDANDFNIYDDAGFWIGPQTFRSFNFNTDPFGYAKGKAILKPGVWKYKIGNHNSAALGPYPAFRQYDVVTVMRPTSNSEKGSEKDDTGHFGINIHKGSLTKTSSLGCQTVPPSQWNEFRDLGYDLIQDHEQKYFNYVLISPIGFKAVG